MPEWTLNPWDNFPQTSERIRSQVEQELEFIERQKEYLLTVRDGLVLGIESLRTPDSGLTQHSPLKVDGTS